MRTLLILAIVAGTVLRDVSGASEKVAPPQPTAAEWVSYRKVRAAVEDKKLADDPKKKNAVVSEEDVSGWLKALDWLDINQTQAFTMERLKVNYPPPYTVCALKLFQETPYSMDAGPTGTAVSSPNTGWFAGPKNSPWQGIKLRESAAEVLPIEDPSQESNKKVEGLKGANFSYARNRITDADSWHFQGALLFPFVWQLAQRLDPNVGLDTPEQKRLQMPDSSHWVVLSYGAIPSVSIFRVSGIENNPLSKQTKNVDQASVRVGAFEKLSVPSEVLQTMTLRAYVTYDTNTSFEYSVPAGQLEWEPQVVFSEYLTIGYATQLINKRREVCDADPSDNSYLAYQFRFRVHAEYGTVTDVDDPSVKTGRFFRAGPIGELLLDPFIVKPLSLSFSYSYLPAIVGSNERNSLLTVGGEWKIAKNQKTHQSLSLKVSYTEGGLDITKAPVRIVLAGLGGTW